MPSASSSSSSFIIHRVSVISLPAFHPSFLHAFLIPASIHKVEHLAALTELRVLNLAGNHIGVLEARASMAYTNARPWPRS